MICRRVSIFPSQIRVEEVGDRFQFFFSFACGGPPFPTFPIWDFAWGFPASKRVTICGVNHPRVHTLRTVNHRFRVRLGLLDPLPKGSGNN